MTNNKNPYALDENNVRNASWDHDVVRAEVLDVLPESHAVRVQPRGEAIPITAPVLSLMSGSYTVPQEGERVLLLYVTDNTPVVLGAMYLADGESPPDAAEGNIRIGNRSGAHLTSRHDGSVAIQTGELSDPIDIDFQVADASMSTDQIVPPDTYTIIEYDTLDSKKDYGIFDPTTYSMTIEADGYHKIRATAAIPLPAQGIKYELAVFINGVEEKRFTDQSSNNSEMSISVHTNVTLDEGDEVDIRLRHNSNSNKTVESDSVSSEFHIDRRGI